MKTEVYSWRLSAILKAELESEARREGTSLATLLGQITAEWLRLRRNGAKDDQEEQDAIRKRAATAIGSIRSGDPTLSSRVREVVRGHLTKKYEESRASRRDR